MIDLIQLQNDVYGLLMSAPQLATVNIVQERRFIVQAELELDAIWQTVRNKCSGDGLLIEEPEVVCNSTGVTGPPQSVELSFVAFQNGDAAFTPAGPGGLAGGGLFASEIEQFVIDLLHLQSVGGMGTIQITPRPSAPARDYPGINARRLKLLVTPRQTRQTPRCATITPTLAEGLLTLACATPGATIYFTTDGSFPCNPAIAVDPLSVTAAVPAGTTINAASTPYAAPIAVQSGQNVRAAAYAPGFNCGEIFNLWIS
jgi:hypothetical protein